MYLHKVRAHTCMEGNDKTNTVVKRGSTVGATHGDISTSHVQNKKYKQNRDFWDKGVLLTIYINIAYIYIYICVCTCLRVYIYAS